MSGRDRYGEVIDHSERGIHCDMIALGIILLILGFIFSIAVLWIIGIILLIIGVVLYLLGSLDRAVFGRRHWY
jgi:hypothetical protein